MTLKVLCLVGWEDCIKIYIENNYMKFMLGIYTSPFHPEAPLKPLPWFEIRDNKIYTSAFHPEAPLQPLPWFEIR